MEDWRYRRSRVKTYLDVWRMLKRHSLRSSTTCKRKPDFKWGLEKNKQAMIQKKIPIRSFKWSGKVYIKSKPSK